MNGATSNFLVVTDDITRKLIRIDLDTGFHTPLAVQNSQYPWGVVYDPLHDAVYWTDRSSKWIARSGVISAEVLPEVFTRLCKGQLVQKWELSNLIEALIIMCQNIR